MTLRKLFLCIAVSVSVCLNLNGQNSRDTLPLLRDTLPLFSGDTLMLFREDSLLLFRVDTLLSYHFPVTDTMFVKLNTLLAIGVVNPAVEIFFNHNNSLQLECMGIFYRKKFSVTGKPLMMGNAFLEYRHYFEKLKGLYLGADVGYGVWKLNRDEVPGFKKKSTLATAASYQVGCNFMYGASIGYRLSLSKRKNIYLDLNWTLGAHLSKFDSFWQQGETLVKKCTEKENDFLPLYKGGAYIVFML